MTRVRANLVLLLAGAVWGMGFVSQSSAMSATGPWSYMAARFWLAALTILPFMLWERRRTADRPSPGDIGGFALCGAALFAGSILQQIGILTTTVTNSGFLTGLYVVMTPAVALLVFGRRPHWVVWPAAALAMFGLLLAGGGELQSLTTGDWLTVGAAAAFAFQIVIVGIFATRSAHPFTLSFVQFATCAALSSLGLLAVEPVDLAGLAQVWPNVLYNGCISGALAFTLQTIGQRWTTAPQAAIFLSSEAVFAALFGAIFLGERIPPIGYVGCALMFAAMMAVELVPLRWPSGRSGSADAEAEGAIGR